MAENELARARTELGHQGRTDRNSSAYSLTSLEVRGKSDADKLVHAGLGKRNAIYDASRVKDIDGLRDMFYEEVTPRYGETTILNIIKGIRENVSPKTIAGLKRQSEDLLGFGFLSEHLPPEVLEEIINIGRAERVSLLKYFVDLSGIKKNRKPFK